MIVGVYGKDGSTLVGPLEVVAQRLKKPEGFLLKLLDGKGNWPGYTVVKLPRDAVHRL